MRRKNTNQSTLQTHITKQNMHSKMAKHLVFTILCSMISALSASKAKPSSSQVEFFFKNSAETTLGGIRYNDVIGRDYTLHALENSTKFIWNIFQQQNPNQRKPIKRLGLEVAVMDGHYYTKDDIIRVASGCSINHPGDLRVGLNTLLFRENTHIWQWNGKGKAPRGLTDGIAGYVMLKAGYAPTHWVKPGQGDRWDLGDDVTARFLEYCNDFLGNGNFVAQLNEKMRDGYSDGFFEELLGKNVDGLWPEYKAKYVAN